MKNEGENSMADKKQILNKLFHCISLIGIILTIIFCVYGYQLGIFHSTDMLSEFISQVSFFGVLVFISIQVVIPIIPREITIKKFTTILLVCKPVSLLAYGFGLKAVMQWVVTIL